MTQNSFRKMVSLVFPGFRRFQANGVWCNLQHHQRKVKISLKFFNGFRRNLRRTCEEGWETVHLDEERVGSARGWRWYGWNPVWQIWLFALIGLMPEVYSLAVWITGRENTYQSVGNCVPWCLILLQYVLWWIVGRIMQRIFNFCYYYYFFARGLP